MKRGVLQSLAAAALALGLGSLPIMRTHGLWVHGVLVGTDLFVCLALGFAILGRAGRSRALSLLKRRSF